MFWNMLFNVFSYREIKSSELFWPEAAEMTFMIIRTSNMEADRGSGPKRPGKSWRDAGRNLWEKPMQNPGIMVYLL